jgi:phenylpyruvate tautomerase PptA (4-oxalocrotonate tautomerase family)
VGENNPNSINLELIIIRCKNKEMPVIKIELIKGREKNHLLQIKDEVMNAVVESLLLPDNDRNIRIQEYEADFFSMKSPYEILIEIIMFEGRTKETKKLLYQKIVDNLYQKQLVDKSKVFIILNEQALENWGVRGGVPADEIMLDFKVNI